MNKQLTIKIDDVFSADLQAIADLCDMRTGVAIPGEDVIAWLESLATDDPLPMPKARKLK